MTGIASLRRIAMLSSVAAVAAACAVLAAPMSASAAGPTDVELSNDGVTYSAGLTAPLYDANIRIIPQSSQTGSFWVRNGSDEVGYLRVVLSDVTGTNADLLDALSVRADTPSASGSSVSLSSAQPCRVLTTASVLAPGASVRIDTALSVADLTGSAGQGGAIDFRLQVGLSSIDLSGTPATTCVADGTTVPVLTPTPTVDAPVAAGAGTAAASISARGFSRAATGGASGAAAPTTADAPRAGLAPMPVPTFILAGYNSIRFYQEDVVFLWTVSSLLGGLLVFIIARYRRRSDTKGHTS